MSSKRGAVPTGILTLNEGSSSLKFGFYAAGPDGIEERLSGQVEGDQPADMFDRIDTALDVARPTAVGHRIVHGGPDLFGPVVIDAGVLAKLERATAFAPLHGPAALSMIRAAQARYPTRSSKMLRQPAEGATIGGNRVEMIGEAASHAGARAFKPGMRTSTRRLRHA